MSRKKKERISFLEKMRLTEVPKYAWHRWPFDTFDPNKGRPSEEDEIKKSIEAICRKIGEKDIETLHRKIRDEEDMRNMYLGFGKEDFITGVLVLIPLFILALVL